MRTIFFCILLAISGVAGADSAFTFSNVPGPYPVGIRVVQQYDYSRSYTGKFDIVSGKPATGERATGERARPIQTLVWYPAQRGGRAMSYGDYADTSATEEEFEKTNPNVIGKLRAIHAGTGNRFAPALKAVLNQPMWAVRDAAALPGKFPLVIYAPSFSARAYENADLCEYLASQGYVVIASADMGASSRAMTGDLEGVEAQAGDIEFLIGYARTLPQVDFDHIAVVGYSWGGLSNLAAAAKDNRISALVSLDGTVRYDNETVKAINYLTPAKISIPYLFVASRPDTLEQLNYDKKFIDISSNFLNELNYSDVYIVSMNAMVHTDFSSYFLRVVPEESFRDGYTRQEAAIAHSWVARYVHQFLDAYLKNNSAALAFLNNDPVKNQVPAHLMRIDARKAKGMAPTLENIGAELARRGFDHAGDVIHDLHLNEPKLKPDEDLLNNWGNQVLQNQDSSRSIQIFKFALLLYPDSSDLYDGLGNAYQVGNDKSLAIQSYRRSLALNPQNENAALQLLESK